MQAKYNYLEKFGSARGRKDLFRLNGGRVIVEILDEGEIKTKGGLFVPESSHARSDVVMNKAVVAQVVLIGEGYFDPDTGKESPIDLEPGEVVVVNEMGLRFYSKFPGLDHYAQNSLAMMTEDDVQMRFPSLAAYTEFKALVNLV